MVYDGRHIITQYLKTSRPIVCVLRQFKNTLVKVFLDINSEIYLLLIKKSSQLTYAFSSRTN